MFFCGYLTLLKIGCFFTLTPMVELESHFEDGSPANGALKKSDTCVLFLQSYVVR